jgi:hypothetical protein
VGETLAETRVEIDAKKAELELASAQLREALDIRKQFRRNPVPFIAAGAAGAFLVVGGPSKVATLVRRRFFPSRVEKAYDSLPKPMQSWVDHMVGAVGPRAGDAREGLALELAAWRSNPRKHGKISKKLARQIAEGPPGPKRAAWTAAEAVATVVLTAVARQAVMRLISGQPAGAAAPPGGLGPIGGSKARPGPAAKPPAKKGAGTAKSADASRSATEGYSTMSAPTRG